MHILRKGVKKNEEKILKVNDHSFHYSTNPRLLGVILDEKVKFNDHIKYIEKRANNAIHIIIKRNKRVGKDLENKTDKDIQ